MLGKLNRVFSSYQLRSGYNIARLNKDDIVYIIEEVTASSLKWYKCLTHVPPGDGFWVPAYYVDLIKYRLK